MKQGPTAGLAAALLALTPAAKAQVDQGPPVVEELVVRAYGGPPWWKVSDADTALYRLADAGGRLPPDFTFNQRRIDIYLDGAREVILPPRIAEPGLGSLVAAGRLETLVDLMHDGDRRDLEPSLPPDIRARFIAARQAIDKPETRYGGLPPALAGMTLAGDALFERAPTRFSRGSTSLPDIVEAAARRKKVRVNRQDLPSNLKVMNEIADAAPELGLPCLVSALDAIDNPVLAERRTLDDSLKEAQAWAEGDVRPVLTRMRRGEQGVSMAGWSPGPDRYLFILTTRECMAGMPSLMRARERRIPDEIRRMVRALGRPGHAVAVVDPLTLLTRGGVLDELKRQGFTVTTPDVE